MIRALFAVLGVGAIAALAAGGLQARTAVDATPPSIVLTVPAPNPCLSGTLTLSGTGGTNAITLSAKKGAKLLVSAAISDAGGLATVDVSVRPAGGTWTSLASFGPADLPWGGAMSTKGAPPGNYEIRTSATDLSSNSAQSASVPFRVCAGDSGEPSDAAPSPAPSRAGYCLKGVFLDLELGQPALDPVYAGAVPAIYIEGVGITCDPPVGRKDAGFKVDGTGAHPVLGAPPNPAAIYQHYE